LEPAVAEPAPEQAAAAVVAAAAEPLEPVAERAVVAGVVESFSRTQ
jgi:hypothetical protein